MCVAFNCRQASLAALLPGILLWVIGTAGALAADPQYNLQYGGAVRVDPDTNRAMVTRDGVTTPLWDGTHRLDDGSILIIRQGTSVPRGGIAEPRRIPELAVEQWEGAPIVGYSPCEKLVHRSCGLHDECHEQEGCKLAQQLLAMEADERASSENPNRMTYTSGQCQNVSQDMKLFPYCK
ncbi:MAG: hypothetical protein WBO34_04420 [Gammaproteobacteria bacterium]